MKSLRYIFLFVDLSFILYWIITFFHLIPPEYLYNNYSNQLMVNWNWSFFPIDILISVTGLTSLYLEKKMNPKWIFMAFISLILTSASGLMAISYWIIAKEFFLIWWIPNLILLFYPLYFITHLLKSYSIKKDSN